MLPGHEQQRLVADHLPLVGYQVSATVRRLPQQGLREDLAAAGVRGLARAARAYDPRVGVRFSRQATAAIQAAIAGELRAGDRPHRTTGSHGCAHVLASVLGREPSATELAQAMGTDFEDVLDLQTVALEELGEAMASEHGPHPGEPRVA